MLRIFRRFRSQFSMATRPPKASAPQAGGTAEGSSGSKAVSGMKPKEEKLAGYLMARAAMNQKVEGQELKNLRAGHETIQQVGDLLPLGRANVIPDIEKTKGEHILLRKVAADTLMDSLMDNHVRLGGKVDDLENNGAIAAASQHAKTGTCGDFAVNILASHAAKLADMKDTRAVVSYTEHTNIPHAWTEMMPKGMRDDGKPILHGKDVILDGWCKEKVAILREDSHFARLDNNGRADHLKHEAPLNHVTGPEALTAVEKYKSQIANSPRFQDVFEKKFQSMVAANLEVEEGSLWKDTSVFHADFRGQAGRALHEGGNPPLPRPDADPVATQVKRASFAEIQAVGVARSLGSNIRAAKAEAPGIIASAKDMFPSSESNTRKRRRLE